MTTTTNKDQIAKWHAERPDWAAHLTARDWDTAELIAEQLDTEFAGENVSCDKAPDGHYCALERGHAGACRVYANP